MKKDMDDVTEKLNVSKDKISSSDEQGNRNVEIIDISVEKISPVSYTHLCMKNSSYCMCTQKTPKKPEIQKERN